MKNIEQKILEMRSNKIGYKKIASMLNIGEATVSKILIENGITDHIKMPSKEIVNSIIFDYKNGMTIKECKKKYGLTRISSILRIAGCEVRPTCYHKEYSNRLDHNFFETIDTEEKAYILGFLYADGYVNENKTCVEIGLAEKDEEILHKINNAIGSTKEIEKRIVKAFGGEFPSVRLTLYSKKLVEDLKKQGCHTRKTYDLSRPSNDVFPEELKRHFIRGYFDGDGCISNKIICIVGTKDMLDYIIEDLQQNAGINKTGSFTMTGEAYQWSHYCRVDVPKVFNYLYKDSNIYLERKYNKFLQTINCRLETKSQKSQDN